MNYAILAISAICILTLGGFFWAIKSSLNERVIEFSGEDPMFEVARQDEVAKQMMTKLEEILERVRVLEISADKRDENRLNEVKNEKRMKVARHGLNANLIVEDSRTAIAILNAHAIISAQNLLRHPPIQSPSGLTGDEIIERISREVSNAAPVH